MNKIIIASDSFKGSLSSAEIADTVEQALNNIVPEIAVHKIKMADGGEGTIEALKSIIKTETVRVETFDPLLRKTEAEYIITDNGTAVIELAAASGITLLKKEELNPLNTSTSGTGILIADALKKGCGNIILTLGGSATNDGGTGILNVLGVVFRDKYGKETACNGSGLNDICSVDISGIMQEAKNARFTLACDVTNPLFGPHGAAFMFAGQKGADKKMIERLDCGLRNFSIALAKLTGKDISQIPGTGAAGGAAGGIMAILNAKIISGAELLLEMSGFDFIAKNADLIITGEGRIDNQTMNGKLPYIVARHAAKTGIPVVALCGRCDIDLTDNSHIPFEIIEVSPRSIPVEEAMIKDNARKFITDKIMEYINGRITKLS